MQSESKYAFPSPLQTSSALEVTFLGGAFAMREANGYPFGSAKRFGYS